MRIAVALLVSIGVGCKATSSTTHNLSYDGIISPDVAIGYGNDESLAKGLSISILGDVNEAMKESEGGLLVAKKECTVDKDSVACIMNGNDGSCIVQHVDGGTVVQMAMHFQSHKDTVTMRAEVTLTASDTKLAREALVRLVPTIDRKLGCTNSLWSIQRRASMIETNSIDSVIAAQEDKDRQAASIEELILNNPLMKNRTRLASTMSDSRSLEVWSYDDVNLKEPVKALFVNGYISVTTAPAGAAHAEALVHPALVAHPSPKRVLVISLSPVAIVKEALKYKSVEHVSVIGSDAAAIDLIQKHLPTVNDCSFLLQELPSCMGSAVVEIIEEDVQAWLEHKSLSALFDIILVDVSIGEHKWLSVEMHGELPYGSEDAITVVSSGSAPSLFDIETETVLSPRETLIRQGARSAANGGFDVNILMYDEPLAKPLSSTYLVFFHRDGELYSKSYYRFIRKNTPAIECDMVTRLHPGISKHGRPTVVYDGSTHLGYLTLSRSWENWYCNTLPGRNLPICDTFLPNWFDSTYHSYSTEVKKVPGKGRALFATEDIPKDHFVSPNDAALSIRIDRAQWEALNKFISDFPEADQFQQLRDFFFAYGFESEVLGVGGWAVSIACNNTFANHGCSDKERTVIPNIYVFDGEDGDEVQFSPPMNRRADLLGSLVMASRDVKAGEEIAMDYHYLRNADNEEFDNFLKHVCSEGIGLVHDSVDDA